MHSRQQEFSAAYVYTLTFKRYNPFVEGGVGSMFFSPIKDFQTTTLDLKRTTAIGGLFGVGVAYELSPSFDIRAEYRGFVAKTPNFGDSNFTTNRYRVLSIPTVGRSVPLLAFLFATETPAKMPGSLLSDATARQSRHSPASRG